MKSQDSPLPSHPQGRATRSRPESWKHPLIGLVTLLALLAGLRLLAGPAPDRRPSVSEGQSSSSSSSPALLPGGSATRTSKASRLLRHYRSQLPQVCFSDPDPILLAASDSEVVLLAGLRLEEVIDVAVVTEGGAPISAISARILRSGNAGACGTLLVELLAGPTVQPGEYRFQLNASRGGIYAPGNISSIVVEDRSHEH